MRTSFVRRAGLSICVLVLWSFVLNDAGADERGTTFFVTNTADSGPESLRQAILDANANPGKDEIEFDIVGPGPHTIQPLTALPTITDPVVIDGYSQDGARPNSNSMHRAINAILMIELDGSNLSGVEGLVITAGNSTVKGLVINRFKHAILLQTNGHNDIEGNFIGTNVSGTEARGNDFGIQIGQGSTRNTIGGSSKADRNLISGNGDYGININGAGTTDNRVEGNFIGTDVTGAADLGNGTWGVLIQFGAANNRVGGSDSDERNLLSGNDSDGVKIFESGASGNKVLGNYIGTDITGKRALGNSRFGVFIQGASGNTIGGTRRDERNIISGNGIHGVLLDGPGTTGNKILGNFIGTDASGKAALPNLSVGVRISAGASGNAIGGTQSGSGNVISGNLSRGISIGTDGTNNNKIQGNYIGVTAEFDDDDDDDDDDDRDRKNEAKTLKGLSPLGNGSDGVAIFQEAAENLVGGESNRAGNIIAYNGGAGVLIENISSTVRNRVSRNSIFANAALGIDLSLNASPPFTDGVTANDAGDTDSGPNNLQNFPVLASVLLGSKALTVTGTIDTQNPEEITIEFFANKEQDPSGNGEGEDFLGTVRPNTLGEFEAKLPEVKAGRFISATATDKTGNTSEFSANVEVVPAPCDLAVEPTSHDFGEVGAHTFVEKLFVLSNSKEAGERCVGDIKLAGDPEFSIVCIRDDDDGDKDDRHGDDDRDKDHRQIFNHKDDKGDRRDDDKDCTDFEIKPGEKHKFLVRFDCRDQKPGARSATLTISSNDPGGDITVPLTGICVAVPDIAAQPEELRFRRVRLGQHRDKTFRLRNEGSADLKVSEAKLAGSHGNDFEVLNLTLPLTLKPGKDVEITVRFSPSELGNRTGRVKFLSNDPDEPEFIVKFRGEGIPGHGITVTPTSGLITTESGGTATFAISANTAPTADVTVPLTSSDTTEGVVPDSVLLPAGSIDSVTVTVTGVDDAIIDRDVDYTIITGDPVSADSNYDALDADDVADIMATNQDDDGVCDLSVDTLMHDFGDVTDDRFADKEFLLFNSPEATRNCIGTIAIAGDPKFSIFCNEDSTNTDDKNGNGINGHDDCTNFNIAPGDTHTFVVRFDCRKLELGDASAAITISSNHPGGDITVSVTGTCVPTPEPVTKQLTFDEAADTYIDGRRTDDNNGANELLRLGNKGSGHRRPHRILIRFDFLAALQAAGVTSSGQVKSATLEMHVFGAFGDDSGGLPIDAIRINRDWAEGTSDYVPAAPGEATYQAAKHGVETWAAAGVRATPADRESTPDDTQLIDSVGPVAWDVSASVQNAIATAQNFGWLLQSQDESKDEYYRLFSSEHASEELRPNLVVVVEVPPAAATALAKGQPKASQVQIEGESTVPEDFSLAQNFPNPFNPETQIRYDIASPATVTLTVFDVTGAVVRRLLERATKPAGTFSVVWDGRAASGGLSASGLYFYRIFIQPQDGAAAPFAQTRRMILLK